MPNDARADGQLAIAALQTALDYSWDIVCEADGPDVTYTLTRDTERGEERLTVSLALTTGGLALWAGGDRWHADCDQALTAQEVSDAIQTSASRV